jgi:phosphatidate cytidylyltransferase
VTETQTRILVGAGLIALTVAVLLFDHPPWYPYLLVFALLVGVGGAWELHGLLKAGGYELPRWLCVGGVVAVLLAAWLPEAWAYAFGPSRPAPGVSTCVLAVFVGVVLVGFLHTMAVYEAPGGSVVRLALLTWGVAYLGLLGSCLVRLRWQSTGVPDERNTRGASLLALTIFAAKTADIGAYFTGRAIGRHKMTPVLSPKKTYEGLAGGLVLCTATALAIQHFFPTLPGFAVAAGFGLTVGFAGVLGDLAESLIKRDVGQKDASHVIPGFGGVLDIIDSLLFAAPVAWCWLL